MGTQIHYDAVIDLETHHLELLQAQEQAVRSVLERSGRRGQYRWSEVRDSVGNRALDLIEITDANSPKHVARVTPLDLTLTAGEFERLLWEGRASDG